MLVFGMMLCHLTEILGTTHTNFMKMQMGLSIRVRCTL